MNCEIFDTKSFALLTFSLRSLPCDGRTVSIVGILTGAHGGDSLGVEEMEGLQTGHFSEPVRAFLALSVDCFRDPGWAHRIPGAVVWRISHLSGGRFDASDPLVERSGFPSSRS